MREKMEPELLTETHDGPIVVRQSRQMRSGKMQYIVSGRHTDYAGRTYHMFFDSMKESNAYRETMRQEVEKRTNEEIENEKRRRELNPLSPAGFTHCHPFTMVNGQIVRDFSEASYEFARKAEERWLKGEDRDKGL